MDEAIANRTRILEEIQAGRPAAADRLLPQVYEELRAMAAHYLQSEGKGHTLQATALVHEAYLKLIDIHRIDWQGRSHFCAVAATAMRRILIDHARQRKAFKRGGAALRVTLDDRVAAEMPNADIDLLELNDVLTRLEALNDRHARVVELRFFAGLTLDETAHVLGVSVPTVKADWRMARAWLKVHLKSDPIS